MYTAIKLGDSTNKEQQRRIVTVQFNNGEGHVFVKDFSFRLTDTLETIKKAVKSYLDEINLVPPTINDLEPDIEVPPPAPTQAELDKIAWEQDVAKLKRAYTDMINLGVTLTASQLTAINNLRNRIAANFKNEYLG